MKVIGAGFPRTGTTSTKIALEQLGFEKCYHFTTLFEQPEHCDLWEMIAEGKSIDWQALFTGFNSAVDWPTSAYYKQLMKEYPDAKILLTVRDPDAWYKSMISTVYITRRLGLSAPEGSQPYCLMNMLDHMGWQAIFHGRFEDKPYALSIFEQWNQEVKNVVPADKLLVWNVKEGWEPLCRFLDVAVPNTPFPHANDTETFRQRLPALQEGSQS